jgi:hypothetical protein
LRENAILDVYIDLSNEIKIEKRVVKSLPELGAKIGGLREVLYSTVFILIGGLQARTFILDQLESLFRVKSPPKKADKLQL